MKIQGGKRGRGGDHELRRGLHARKAGTRDKVRGKI